MSIDEERDEFVRRVVAAVSTKSLAFDLWSIKDPVGSRARSLALDLWSLRVESAKLAEDACNRELTKGEIKRDAELDEIVAKIVAKIGKELGLKAYRQGDPRGNTIRVEVGPEFADNWGCG